jgi:tetratricopeptide (TPR) repeat protein
MKIAATLSETFGDDNVLRLDTLNSYGYVLERLGEFEDAEKVYWQAALLASRIYDEPEPSAYAFDKLVRVAMMRKAFARSEVLQRQCVEIWLKSSSNDASDNAAEGLVLLSEIQRLQGAVSLGERSLKRAIDIWSKAHGDRSLSTGKGWSAFGEFYSRTGNHRKSIDCYKAAISVLSDFGDEYVHAVSDNRVRLGGVFLKCNESASALAEFDKARETIRSKVPPDQFAVAKVESSIGDLYSEQGQVDSAIPYFERAVAVLTEAFGPQDARTAIAREKLLRLTNKRSNR